MLSGICSAHIVCAAGVTAGIDGTLRVVADLRGAEVAQAIQLSLLLTRPNRRSEAAHPNQRRPQCRIECGFGAVRLSYRGDGATASDCAPRCRASLNCRRIVTSALGTQKARSRAGGGSAY
jgi:hypothetical protein